MKGEDAVVYPAHDIVAFLVYANSLVKFMYMILVVHDSCN